MRVIVLFFALNGLVASASDRMEKWQKEAREERRVRDVERHGGRVWVPSELPVVSAAHSDTGYEVTAHLYLDANAGGRAFSPEVGYHHKELFINGNFMRETRYRATFLYNPGLLGAGAAGWSAELGQNLDFLVCAEEEHCLAVGANVDIDGGFYATEAPPNAYYRASSVNLQGEAGYVFTRNNQTFLLKLIGGGDLGFNMPQTMATGGANLGVKSELLLGNKLAIIASVLHHISLTVAKNDVTEGKLGVKVRLWHSPDQDSGSKLKSVNWQFELKAFHGEINERYPNDDFIRPITTFTSRTGLVVDY